MLLPCVEALAKDFDNRFGDGSDILTFREGPQRQLQGFQKVQVMATALDPRCKILYGVLPNEHEGVWQAVAMAAADIAKSTQASIGATASSAAGSTPGGPGPGASARPASKRFCGGFMAASQAQATSASTTTATPSLPVEHFLKEAEREVTRYRAASGLAMEEAQESGKILYPDLLNWWRINAVKFPLLAALALRLLAIPASQTQSERVFSSTGQIVTQTRNRLSSENVELLVALKNIWTCCCCCFLTLTDPLRIQPWSQDRRNQTKSNRESEISMESRQKRTDKEVASKGHCRDKIENINKNTQTVETN